MKNKVLYTFPESNQEIGLKILQYMFGFNCNPDYNEMIDAINKLKDLKDERIIRKN